MTRLARHTAADLTPLARRRLCWRAAKGEKVLRAARREGLRPPAAKELLADKSFSALVDCYRGLAELPEEEQHRRLVELAVMVLQEAIIAGDVRVALYVFKHQTQGRLPAEVLARSVIRSLERPPPKSHAVAVADSASDEADSVPDVAVPREPACPVDSAISKGGALLRDAVMDEHEMRMRVEHVEAAKTTARPITPTQAAFIIERAAQSGEPADPTRSTDIRPNQPRAP